MAACRSSFNHTRVVVVMEEREPENPLSPKSLRTDDAKYEKNTKPGDLEHFDG